MLDVTATLPEHQTWSIDLMTNETLADNWTDYVRVTTTERYS